LFVEFKQLVTMLAGKIMGWSHFRKSTYDPKHNKLTVHLWTGLNTDPRSEAFISTSAIVFDT